ncbi:TPA: phosphate uptake regulator PhoU [archaeon]|uniref:Phosphate uptake regulator PhoU n=1 Tax=Candidatus Naiadarchaeum limnaeum TaxID=2756139 RepID=A0A832V1B7_9ARCH|nr:phosphate uptake regulator PhoU [Candidatus Naiadarchaeales archaeon SRR2090153.bin1042]HIK00213.1 phosphate uptake regulator PhoU [Candidatus Naiadarchaeum limnaeum]
MELRKLQKTGGSTYVVSLPKKWIERERLDRGSFVTIKEQKDGSISITPGSRKEDGTREIQITADQSLLRHLIEKYLLGYDILRIKSKTKFKEKEKAEIKRNLNRLVGLEIMEETSDSITVHYLLDPEEVSILKTLRRMYTIVSVMHKDLITALETGDKHLLRDVIQRDTEVNRLYFLLVRQIRTGIQNPSILDREGITSLDCVDYRLVVKIIEAIGDNLTYTAKKLIEIKNVKFSDLKKFAQETFEIHKRAFEALLKKDESLAMSARELRQNLKIVRTKASSVEIINNLTKVADFGQDLADIVVCE